MKDDRKDTDELRGALARGYCTKRNSQKVLDPDLIQDMAKEVERLAKPLEPIDEETFREEARLILWELMGYGKQTDGTNFFPDDFVGEKMERAIDEMYAKFGIKKEG